MQSKPHWLIKRYRIFVHKVHLQSGLNIKTISLSAGRACEVSANLTYEVNQQVQLCAIGRGKNPNQISESQAFLIINGLYEGEQKTLGTVGFDFKTQKPGSRTSQMRHKELIEGNGSISYKFLGSQYMEIDQSLVEQQRSMRQQIMIEKKSNQKAQREAQYAQMVRLVSEKDEIIRNLEDKMSSLLKQTRSLHQNLSKQKQRVKKTSLQKTPKSQKQPFSINVNVQSNATENEVKKLNQENERLKFKIHQLQIKIEGLQDHIDDVESQLSEKRSMVNAGEFYSKEKPKKSMAQSRYQNQKSSIVINRGDDMVSEKPSRKGLQRAVSSINYNNNIHADEDWQKRRQRRTQERRKQRAQQLQIQAEYQKRQQQTQMRMKKQQQQVRKRQKSSYQRAQRSQNKTEESVIHKTINIQGSFFNQAASRADQHKLRLLVHKLEQEKMVIQQRLYAKKDEAESIYRELQRAKNREKKLQQQIQSFRSMVNYYKSHGISLGQISENQKEYLKNLGRRNALGAAGQTDQPEMHGKQRQTMIEEKLRFQIVELKDEIQNIKNQHRIQLEEKDMQILKRKMAQEAQRKEKEVYVSKYRGANEVYQKQRLDFQDAFDKAQELPTAMSRIKDLQNQGMQLASKLSKQSKQKFELADKVKRFTTLMEDREIQFQRLRNLQSNHEVLKAKCYNMEKANQKFSENYKELKRFALKIEQMLGKKPRKGFSKSDPNAQQEYEKQLIKGLDELESKVRDSEKSYYQQHLQALNQQKNLYKNLYEKRLQQQTSRVTQTLSADKASKILQQRVNQINALKQDRLREVDSKIERFERLLEIVGSRKPPSDLIQRVQQLRVKLSSEGTVSNQSIKQMKETNQRLLREIKIKQDQINHLKRSSLIGVGIQDDRMKTRTTMMEDFIKTKQMLSKPFQDIKKINHDLMKAKNMLQIEVQNSKIREEQLQIRLKEKQKDAQRIAKKIDDENARKFDEHARVQNRLNEELQKLKASNTDLETSVRDLVEELKSISETLQNKEIAFNKLQGQNSRLEQRLIEYEHAEKKLFDEVERVKKDASNNQAQFQRLFLERDEKFLKIQKMKTVQIEKLKDEVNRVQEKLEKEILDGLKLREENDKYLEAMAEYDQQIRAIREAQEMQEATHRDYVQETKAQIQAYQQQNDTLKQNLLELAEQINEKELEVEEYKIKLEFNQKRVDSLEKLNKQYKTSDEQSYLEKIEAHKLIDDQCLEIKKLEANLQIIQSKISMLAQENDHYRDTNDDLKEEIKELRINLKSHENDLQQSNREKIQLDNFVEKAEKNQVEYEKKEKDFKARIKQLENQVNSLEFERIDNEAKIKQLQMQLKEQKGRKSSGNIRRSRSRIQDDGGSGYVDKKSSSNIRRSRSRIQDDQKSNQISRKASRMQAEGSSYGELKSPNQIRRSRSKIQEDQKPNQLVKRTSRMQKDGSNVNIDKKQTNKIKNKASMMSKDSSEQRSSTLIRKASKMSKEDEFMQSKRISNKSKVCIQYGTESIKKDQGQGSIKSSKMSGQQSINQIDPSSSNRIELQEVKQSEQDNVNSNLLYSKNEVGRMKLERKGSNVEIEVSQCQSQPIEEQGPMNDSKIDKMLGENSLEGQQFLDEGSQQQQQQQEQDISALLNQIEDLKQQRQGLLDKIQQQQDDIEGLKAELMTWKKVGIDGKPSMQQISHGFTSELNQKLMYQDQQLDEDGSGMRKKPSFDGFSRSQVVQKPSAVLGVKRSSSRFDVAHTGNDQRTNKILLDEAEQNIKQLQRQLDEERNNVEKMIEVNKEIQEETERANQRIKTLQVQKIQMIEEIQGIRGEMESRNQQMTAEILQKDERINDLNSQIRDIQRQLEGKEAELLELESKLRAADQENQNKLKGMKNMKKEFRKYEEEAQLQILKLKQGLSKIRDELKLKSEDITTVGDRYIELEEKYTALQIDLRNKDSLILGKESENNDMMKKYYDVVNLLKEQEVLKNEALRDAARLKSSLQEKEQDMAMMGKQSSLTIKKYCIRVESLQQQTQSLRKKLEEREEHIGRLKHEIMLYNQSIQQVTKSKQSLSTELEKVEGQLKDIMVSYQGEFQQLSQAKKFTQSQVQEYSGLCKQKDQELAVLNKDLQQKNREIKDLTARLDENTKSLQRFKIKARNQLNDVHTQLQIKNDECQKLKIQAERECQAFFSKECQFIEDKQKSEAKIKDYKQKFMDYEKQIEELAQQLMQYSNRPPVEQWEQANFQNQLYRNRIAQLQSNLRQQQQNSQEQLIYAEFRKYKINKQREIQDLEMQMERYGNKLNELQEANFYQKKQIEGLKHQIKISSNQKQKLQTLLLQLQEENEEIKIQLDLFKARRAQDLGKALDFNME